MVCSIYVRCVFCPGLKPLTWELHPVAGFLGVREKHAACVAAAAAAAVGSTVLLIVIPEKMPSNYCILFLL